MRAWKADELERLGRADEVGVASRRPDGTLRGFVTIWAVRVGDAIYIRSAHGFENPWFQQALHSGQGRIRAAGLSRISLVCSALSTTHDTCTDGAIAGALAHRQARLRLHSPFRAIRPA